MKRSSSTLAFVVLLACSVGAEPPKLQLGAKPALGLFQPRVSVEIYADDAGTQSLGPTTTSFLLDTGASGVLVYPPATTELDANGFENVGTFDEAGLSGTTEFNLSAPYRIDINGTGGDQVSLNQVRMLSGESAPDPTGLMGLNGIVGMPSMRGRVTSIDNRVREGAISLSMGVSFANELPVSNTQRFTVPLNELAFPTEGELVPTFESLSTLEVVSQNGTNISTDQIVLDSGAQITIISESIAHALGLDANGNGDFLDEASSTVPLSGATGTINAPVLRVPEIRVPTDQGFDLTWTNADVVILDIHPSISGVLGADFMTGDGGLDLSLIGGSGSGLTDLLGGLLGDTSGLGDLGGGDLGDLGGLLEGILGGGGLLGGGSVDLDELFDELGLGSLNPAAADDDDPLDDPGGLGDLGGLLGGLLGGGGAGGTDLFASFPLESYFDQVHFDFRGFPEQQGQLVFDVNPSISASILNGDHVLDARDIDDMTANIGLRNNEEFDLNGDGGVSQVDRDLLIAEVFGTKPGDTDLDGDVDFSDFLTMSAAFGTDGGGWANGDFDGTGSTDFGDFLALSANFGKPIAAASVPEPSTALMCSLGLIGFGCCNRRRRR